MGHDVETAGSGLGGLPVTFRDLTYTVKAKKGPLNILSGVNGYLEAGKMTALMGPSGSGKTTLMDILAGRKSGAGTIKGEVLYGGNVIGKKALGNVCGYVEQFDTLVGDFTVWNMLMYTAELKLPLSMSKKDKTSRCEDVLNKLGLAKCKDTKIGNPLRRGISGGQAKRVNIALALITRPQIVFLDEPTSGLDVRMANDVCLLAKALAKDGCTVVCTIHSPSGFAFEQFDNVLMLNSVGKVVYQGSISEAQPYFESRGFQHPVGQSHSLPDWLVDITADAPLVDGVMQSEDFARQTTAEAHSTSWLEAPMGRQSQEWITTAAERLKSCPVNITVQSSSGPGQLYALKTLLSYRMASHYRSGEFLGPRIGDKVFMSVLILSLYWGIGNQKDAQSIQSTTALLYFVCALCGYGAAAYVPSLVMERPLFYRERADGCYNSLTYYISKFVEEAVLATFTATIFSLIVFFALSLQGNFFVFAFVYYLCAMCGICLAYAVAAVAPNMEAANGLLPTYVTTCMYFGGFFIIFNKIPPGWYWYSFTSFLRYGWGALMLNQYKGQEIGQALFFYDSNGIPKNVLQFFAMDTGIMSDMWSCVGVLAGLVGIFAVLGALGVAFVSHVKR